MMFHRVQLLMLSVMLVALVPCLQVLLLRVGVLPISEMAPGPVDPPRGGAVPATDGDGTPGDAGAYVAPPASPAGVGPPQADMGFAAAGPGAENPHKVVVENFPRYRGHNRLAPQLNSARTAEHLLRFMSDTRKQAAEIAAPEKDKPSELLCRETRRAGHAFGCSNNSQIS